MFRSSLQEDEGGALLTTSPQSPVARYLHVRSDRPDAAITQDYVRSLNLTTRDRAIVRLIGELGYLATSQIARLWYSHTTRPVQKAGERLLRLWEQHVLDREVGAGLVAYGLPYQMVYKLGRAGRYLIGEQSEKASRRKTFGMLTVHNVLVGEVAVHLMEALREPMASAQMIVYGEQFLHFSWEDRSVKLRPDALFVLRLDDGELPFFVELDTGTESMDAFVTKQLSYGLYYRSNAWREQHRTFPGVLVVCGAQGDDEEKRRGAAQRRLARILQQIRDQRTEVGVKWFFTTLDAAGTLDWPALVGRNDLRRIQLLRSQAQ